jgi:hypothetical protein
MTCNRGPELRATPTSDCELGAMIIHSADRTDTVQFPHTKSCCLPPCCSLLPDGSSSDCCLRTLIVFTRCCCEIRGSHPRARRLTLQIARKRSGLAANVRAIHAGRFWTNLRNEVSELPTVN